MKYSFDEWKAKGLDEHSLVADPLFVDAANRELLTLARVSVLKLGFKPLDIRRVGPSP